MNKLILSIVGLMTLTAVHAQQTVVIERPGILTDLATAAGALVALPLAAAEGIVTGTVEAAGALIHGSTEVVMTPAPVAGSTRVVVATSAPVIAPAPVVSPAPAPVVVAPPVVAPAPAPVVVAPQVVTPAPVVVPSTTVVTTHSAGSAPTTTVVTRYRDGSVTTLTRPASSYELGPVVLTPVDPDHRVGTSPFVNPYVYRHR